MWGGQDYHISRQWGGGPERVPNMVRKVCVRSGTGMGGRSPHPARPWLGGTDRVDGLGRGW